MNSSRFTIETESRGFDLSEYGPLKPKATIDAIKKEQEQPHNNLLAPLFETLKPVDFRTQY